ncbi:sciellin isoform X2 [Echeneis naucrates]|uniref:sciellin isoform X2 n=1 Tax=Echeneis naucrates TaxID=173247 RepID=UPI001113605B|nr:sciellin isoform X2 [Echeneis naucrates]
MSWYSSQTSRSTRPSQMVEDSKRKSNLLKDNSWIKKPEDEDEAVDRDPNYGKSILGRYRSNENLESSEDNEVKSTTTTTVRTPTSVLALSKRFSGSQDELKSSTLPPSSPTSSYTKSTYSSLKSPSTTTTSKTTVTEQAKTSTTTSTITKDGKTTKTTTTTSKTVGSPTVKSPTKTETFTERVLSTSKEAVYSNFTPTKTTKVTETTVTSDKSADSKLNDALILSLNKDESSPSDSKTTVTTTETVIVKSSPVTSTEDMLYDTLIPKSTKDDATDSKTNVYTTETVTVKSSTEDSIKTSPTIRTSSTAEDDLYDTLLPKGITSVSSPVSSSITKREVVTVESSRGGETPTLSSPSFYRSGSYSSYTDDSPSTRTTSYSTKPSYEYTSITSPTVYSSSSYRSSRSDDLDSLYPSSSMRSSYKTSERTVLEKDLCTSCRKPFTGDAKMVLDDLKINCHASCFKCEVCNTTLGHLKAGDSMWIYRRMVHCENCFEITRDKWRR